MSGPVLEYQPVRPGPKRRDTFGKASLALLAIHLAIVAAYSGYVGPSPALATCFDILCAFLSVAFALSSIVLMRGKSLTGWATLAILGAFAFSGIA